MWALPSRVTAAKTVLEKGDQATSPTSQLRSNMNKGLLEMKNTILFLRYGKKNVEIIKDNLEYSNMIFALRWFFIPYLYQPVCGTCQKNGRNVMIPANIIYWHVVSDVSIYEYGAVISSTLIDIASIRTDQKYRFILWIKWNAFSAIWKYHDVQMSPVLLSASTPAVPPPVATDPAAAFLAAEQVILPLWQSYYYS